MFETQLGLRENPFAAGHQPRYVYPSPEHQEALAHLRFGIENREPFVLITGEVGTGKTTAIYDALHGWGTRAVVALVTNSALTRAELLEEIALRFGLALPPGTSKPQAMVQLERHLLAIRQRGELAVLLLDEAQNLDRELLEEIRLLSNLEMDGQKLLQIFLVGQPELEAKLISHELRQLRQRIAVHYRINPLSRDETEHYIHHRVAVAGGNAYQLFPAESCTAVYRLTHGIPREINTVAGQALVNAFVEDSHTVRPDHVHAVARDSEFHSVLADQPIAPTADELLAEKADATVPAPPVVAPGPPPVVPAPPVRVVEPPVVRAPEPPAMRAPEPPVVRVPEPPPMRAAEQPPSPEPPPTPEPPPPPRPTPPVHEVVAVVPPVAAPDPTPPAPSAREENEFQMPAWLDDAIANRQASAPATPPAPVHETPAPTTATAAPAPAPAAAPAPPAPVSRGSAVPPVSATRGTVPPRIAPHPGAPQGTGLKPDFLPARLREKIVEEPARGSRSTPWLVAAAIIAVVAIAVVLVLRFGVRFPWSGSAASTATTAPAETSAPEPGTQPAASEVASEPAPTSTVAESARVTPPPASAPVTQAPAQPASPAPKPVATSTPPEKTPAPSSGSASQVAGATTAGAAVGAASTPSSAGSSAGGAAKRTYGVVVGTFLNQERASEEAARIGDAAKLPHRTLTVQEGGTSVYRVVIGRFDTNLAAERAATDLIVKGLSNEARVVTLK
jgi:general secretion pathway protein A